MAGFEETPEDKVKGFPCPKCAKGSVTLIDGNWTCDTCDFEKIDKSEKD